MSQDKIKIKRALLSVSDKAGLAELAKKLAAAGVELISTGGTGKFLGELGLSYTPVEKLTGTPECFGGRVKTLSWQVSGAILFRREEAEDVARAKELGIEPIDLLVCNLYPFEAAAQGGARFPALVEKIDIGGPTMIRAAAKNHSSVAVVVSPAQYGELGLETTAEQRARFALEAFRHTGRYDGLIAAKMEESLGVEMPTVVVAPEKAKTLRYGENPHQKAWVYTDPFHPGIASAEPMQGKELSYNNLLDADAAWRACGDISGDADFSFACAVVKHLTPCGLGLAKTQLGALELAWAGDPVSAFGGILCFNSEVGADIAQWLGDKFVEVIVAPSFSKEALEIFGKKKNLRLLATPAYDGSYKAPMVKSISGGFVVQQEDTGADEVFDQVTTQAMGAVAAAVKFGVMACKHLKSNAIGLFSASDKGLSMLGAGMGNPNRLVSIKQAVEKALENGHADLSSAVLVSDAFFPFPDNIDMARAAGIKSIVQPGGSVKDKDVIAAANDAGMAMVFTHRRHFRH